MLLSWPPARGMARKHLARQLRDEALRYLQSGEPLPQPLADWLAVAIESKDIDLFAEPWEEFVPTEERHRRMEMAIMARIMKNRPELLPATSRSSCNFCEAVADLFSTTARIVRDAYDEHHEMLDFLEERMGLKHLPTKGDILAYQDVELERVAEALEETIRSKQELIERFVQCLKSAGNPGIPESGDPP